MAEGFLSGLVGTILENLKSLILEEVPLKWNYQTELKNLKSTLSTIQAVLHDAEQKEIRSAAMRDWLRKLKDAAYDADDFLDAYKTDVLSWNLKGQFATLNSFVFRFGLGNRIKEIQERLDGIAAERSKFHLKDAMVVEEPLDSVQSHQTHSFVIESEIHGREDDKKNIVKLLMAGVSSAIIAIVGMGGIGKTTVAQLVYNDKTVEDHFGLRIWVSVFERLDERGFQQQAIIESVTGNKCDIYNMGTMTSKLRGMILGKKFLLVLDNAWSEDHETWDTFKQVVLTCGLTGSKVIVTTRSKKVAIILGNVNPYHLEVLSDEDCWPLFEQRAFGTSREKKPNLVAIGKEIVKKCGGVPLAAKALGSMMLFKNDEKQWLSIKESEIWNLPDDDENVILPALRLSYSHLSLHLKQCFAYCSIFPKGYVINKDKLILLWMANGFIPAKPKMTLEDVGNEIFSDLLMSSFFQSVQQTDDGTVTKCKMHDLVSDLAQSITRDEC